MTFLVGRNESGKTALLQALYRLNPVIENQGTFDVTEDNPRAEEEDYQQAIERGDPPARDGQMPVFADNYRPSEHNGK